MHYYVVHINQNSQDYCFVIKHLLFASYYSVNYFHSFIFYPCLTASYIHLFYFTCSSDLHQFCLLNKTWRLIEDGAFSWGLSYNCNFVLQRVFECSLCELIFCCFSSQFISQENVCPRPAPRTPSPPAGSSTHLISWPPFPPGITGDAALPLSFKHKYWQNAHNERNLYLPFLLEQVLVVEHGSQ